MDEDWQIEVGGRLVGPVNVKAVAEAIQAVGQALGKMTQVIPTAVASDVPDESDEIRRALLFRLALDLEVARSLHNGSIEGGCWSCCWVKYWHRTPVSIEPRAHRLCSTDCPHWHHQTEVFPGVIP